MQFCGSEWNALRPLTIAAYCCCGVHSPAGSNLRLNKNSAPPRGYSRSLELTMIPAKDPTLATPQQDNVFARSQCGVTARHQVHEKDARCFKVTCKAICR